MSITIDVPHMTWLGIGNSNASTYRDVPHSCFILQDVYKPFVCISYTDACAIGKSQSILASCHANPSFTVDDSGQPHFPLNGQRQCYRFSIWDRRHSSSILIVIMLTAQIQYKFAEELTICDGTSSWRKASGSPTHKIRAPFGAINPFRCTELYAIASFNKLWSAVDSEISSTV